MAYLCFQPPPPIQRFAVAGTGAAGLLLDDASSACNNVLSGRLCHSQVVAGGPPSPSEGVPLRGRKARAGWGKAAGGPWGQEPRGAQRNWNCNKAPELGNSNFGDIFFSGILVSTERITTPSTCTLDGRTGIQTCRRGDQGRKECLFVCGGRGASPSAPAKTGPRSLGTEGGCEAWRARRRAMAGADEDTARCG